MSYGILVRRKCVPEPVDRHSCYRAWRHPDGGWSFVINDGRVPGTVMSMTDTEFRENFTVSKYSERDIDDV